MVHFGKTNPSTTCAIMSHLVSHLEIIHYVNNHYEFLFSSNRNKQNM